jgi:hypothetical protein
MEEDQIPESSQAQANDVNPDHHEFFDYANSVTEHDLSRRRKRRAFATTGIVTVIVLVIAIVVVGGGGPGSSDAAAQVIRGARTTLAEDTADLQITGSFSANGQSVPVSGSGYADLSSGLETMTTSFDSSGTTLQETVLQNGGAMYMQVMQNNQNSITQLLPGKSWVQLPDTESTPSGLGAGTSNILAQLQLLASRGNTVVSLGSSTMNGQSVSGYQVTITRKAMSNEIKQAEAKGGVAASAMKAALKNFSLNPLVLDVWLGTNDLVQSEKIVLSGSEGGVPIAGDLDIVFSNYGSPVTVSIPAANQIVSYSAFLSAAKAAG